jgi:Uma2 family endonuclease
MGAMPLRHDIYYPESDGQPMAESTVHWWVMVNTAQALVRRYAETPDVWVGSNLLLYYQEGRPELSVAPDVLVVRGVAKWDRPIFKLWEEGNAPCFVLEATSNSSRRQDPTKKKDIYQRIGVEEYFLFDPLNEYLRPRLQGFQLTARGYEPIPRLADGSLPSQTTGLLLCGEGVGLRLVDAATGTPLLWKDELDAAFKAAEAARQAAEERARRESVARQAAEERAEQETVARRALEEELARLRSELA